VLTYLVGTQTNETSGAALLVGLTVSVDLAAFRHESMSGKSPTLSAPVPLLATHIKISAVGIIHRPCVNRIILYENNLGLPDRIDIEQHPTNEFGRKYKVGPLPNSNWATEGRRKRGGPPALLIAWPGGIAERGDFIVAGCGRLPSFMLGYVLIAPAASDKPSQ
jgi:hypothetical protein